LCRLCVFGRGRLLGISFPMFLGRPPNCVLTTFFVLTFLLLVLAFVVGYVAYYNVLHTSVFSCFIWRLFFRQLLSKNDGVESLNDIL